MRSTECPSSWGGWAYTAQPWGPNIGESSIIGRHEVALMIGYSEVYFLSHMRQRKKVVQLRIRR